VPVVDDFDTSVSEPGIDRSVGIEARHDRIGPRGVLGERTGGDDLCVRIQRQCHQDAVSTEFRMCHAAASESDVKTAGAVQAHQSSVASFAPEGSRVPPDENHGIRLDQDRKAFFVAASDIHGANAINPKGRVQLAISGHPHDQDV
jgi:hypothetical protein